MERILKIVIDLLRGATYDYETKFTQADSQSHYLQIDFSDTSLNFSGVSMKVNFIRSDGVAVTTSKASVTSSNKVQIPTNALAKFGELGIEIILIKGDSILTVNKLIRVTVIKTLAGEGIDLEIGDSFLNEINQLTVNLSKVLTGEGDKQIERVRATGNEVVKQVESILGNNPEGGNAAAVGGLSRAGIETLIDNVVGKVEDGKFPLTSAEVGKVYEAVNGKKYKCIKAYSGSSLSTPNANFIEMSLNNHADRLDNLITNQILVEKIKIQGKGTGIIEWQTIEIKLSKIKTILGVSAVPIISQSQIDFLSYSITSIKYRVYSSSGEPVLSTNSYIFEMLVFGY